MSWNLDTKLANEVHTVPPPVEDNELAIAIAVILASGASANVRINAIHRLLRDLGISKQAVLAAYGASSESALVPNNKPGQFGLDKSNETMQAARKREAYYRAMYVVSSSRRIQEKLNEGEPVRAVLADESMNYRRHKDARRNRLDAVGNTAAMQQRFGPVLGWYLNPLLNNESECIAANGHNFLAVEGTIIGYPGAVHPNCGCKAGPPYPGGMGNSCNEALSGIVRKGKQARYTVRNAPRTQTLRSVPRRKAI